MSARELGGREAAASLQREVEAAVRALGTAPRLSVFAPVADEASAHYGRMITRTAAKVGIEVRLHEFDPHGSADVLRRALQEAAASGVHGLQVHKPLPRGISASELLEEFEAEDVEGLGPRHVGRLLAGRPRFVPCTALAVWRILHWHGIALDGQRALVLGRSDIVGAPLATLLQQSGATVTVAHTRTRDLATLVAGSDLVISAAGQRDLVPPESLKAGAVLADVGHHVLDDGSVRGDFSIAHHQRAAAFTPVPGGVGPLTTLCLLESVARAAARALDKPTALADPRRPFHP